MESDLFRFTFKVTYFSSMMIIIIYYYYNHDYSNNIYIYIYNNIFIL